MASIIIRYGGRARGFSSGGTWMRPRDPEAVAARFAELVIRATARAARHEREHLPSSLALPK